MSRGRAILRGTTAGAGAVPGRYLIGTGGGTSMAEGAVPAGTDDGTILCSVPEAARLLGISERAVRKRLTTGTLQGEQEGVHGPWTVHLPPELLAGGTTIAEGGGTGGGTGTASGAVPSPAPTEPGVVPETEPLEARYRVTPAEIEQAVSRTSAQYMGDLRTMLAEVGKVYEGRIAATEAQIAAQQETIAELRRQRDEDRAREDEDRAREREALAELRRRTEAAEAAADALRLQLAEVSVPAVVVVAGQEATEVPHTNATTPAAHRGVEGLWWRLRRAWRGR